MMDVATAVGAAFSSRQSQFFENAADVSDVEVWREYNPKTDNIDFFLIFTKHGRRWRLFLDATGKELDLTTSGADVAWYMVGRCVQAILDGKSEPW